jgi:hypothetical protein
VSVAFFPVSVTGTSFFGSLELILAQSVASPSDPSSYSLNAGDTLDDEILSSDGTGLVKATNIDPASERDSEGLGAEDCYGSACGRS